MDKGRTMSDGRRYSIERAAGWQPSDEETLPKALYLPVLLWWLWWSIGRWLNGRPPTEGDALAIRERLLWLFTPMTTTE